MIDFHTENIAKAMELGQQAATLVNKEFRPPIKLLFEKVHDKFFTDSIFQAGSLSVSAHKQEALRWIVLGKSQ